MTNDTGTPEGADHDAAIKALEEQLAAAKAQAKIKALQDELAALQGAETLAPVATQPEPAAAPVTQPAPAAPAAVPAPVAQPAARVAPPAPQSAPAARPAPSGKRGGLVAALVVMVLALVATLGGTYFAIRGDLRAPWAAAAPAPVDLALIPTDQFGPNPFVTEDPTVVTYPTVSTASTGSVPEPMTSLSVAAVSGDTPETYGFGYGSCPSGALLDRLDADAASAAAWVAALNSDPDLGFESLTAATIESFWANLVVAVLLADTRVTFNGYAAGAVFPTQAVLQKGTIVMIDRYGVPRVHCRTGVPLTTPSTGGGEITFSGSAWGDFAADTIVRMEATQAPLSEVTVLPVGPSNVDTAFTIAIGRCAIGEPCTPPAVGDTNRERPEPTTVPTPTVCGSYASGTTEADWLRFRLVNATTRTVFLTDVSAPEFGCTAQPWASLQPGGNTASSAAPGWTLAFSDGTSTTTSGEFVMPSEPTLWVIQ